MSVINVFKIETGKLFETFFKKIKLTSVNVCEFLDSFHYVNRDGHKLAHG